MGWARGFEIGTRVAGDLLDTYNASKQRSELEKIANAQPEQSQGFTPEQGEQVRAAAESGQYDVGYDDASKSYTLTPKADPSQTGRIGMQGVTDFNGQRTAGAMSESQVANARARGMAGVVMKSDPVQGMRMMRDVTQGERDDQRFAWEKDRNERDLRQGKEQESDREVMRGIEQSAGEWFKNRLAGPNGTQRAATVDDHLAASQYRAAKLVEAGKLDAAGKVFSEYSAQSMAKIQLQTEERNQALGVAATGLASGDFGAVKDFYNKYIPDGAHVTNVGKGPKGEILIERESADGRPMPPTTLKDTGQLLSALSSFKDPMAIYNYSQNEFRNNLALKADSRAGASLELAQNAERRAQADFETGQPRKQLESTVATLQLGLANVATPEERTVIQDKINAIQASTGGGKDQPAEVKLAQAIVNAGMAPDMKSALSMAISKKGQSAEEIHQGFVSANIKNMATPEDAVKKANAVMQEMGYSKKGNQWSQAGGQEAAKPLQNVTPADIAATAKKYNISEDEVKRRLNLK